ncbi:MAG: hypothetical protein Q7S12_02525 [bacterium]|nr:hypothetical protein [bacterium]
MALRFCVEMLSFKSFNKELLMNIQAILDELCFLTGHKKLTIKLRYHWRDDSIVYSYRKSTNIFLSSRLAKVLSDGEISFCLMHEIAHKELETDNEYLCDAFSAQFIDPVHGVSLLQKVTKLMHWWRRRIWKAQLDDRADFLQKMVKKHPKIFKSATAQI